MEKHIIACIDASNYAESVAKGAGWLGKNIGVPVTLLHVLEAKEKIAIKDPDMGQYLSDIEMQQYDLEKKRGETLLSIAYDKIQKYFALEAQKRLVTNGFLEQLEIMNDITRVVVVGRRGENSSDKIGSHIEQILQNGNRPLMIVDEKFSAPTSVLVAFDGSKTMIRGIDTIAESPLFKNLECHVVLVGAETDEHIEELRWAKATLNSGKVNVTTRLLQENNVHDALTNYAKEHSIECLVMGASSHSKLRKLLLGSKADTIIKDNHGTLIILR